MRNWAGYTCMCAQTSLYNPDPSRLSVQVLSRGSLVAQVSEPQLLLLSALRSELAPNRDSRGRPKSRCPEPSPSPSAASQRCSPLTPLTAVVGNSTEPLYPPLSPPATTRVVSEAPPPLRFSEERPSAGDAARSAGFWARAWEMVVPPAPATGTHTLMSPHQLHRTVSDTNSSWYHGFVASLRTDNCPQPKEAQPLSHALTSDSFNI
jgi:hypothetical protein